LAIVNGQFHIVFNKLFNILKRKNVMDFNHNNIDAYISKLLNNNECFFKNIYIYLDLQLNFMIDIKTLILFIYGLIIHF